MNLLYKGKAKSVYEIDSTTSVIEFRDDITAGDGAKKETMPGKGALNAEISAKLFDVLNARGIKTHFIKFEPPNRHVVKRVKIILLEVICRNIAAGSFVKRYPFKNGEVLKFPVVEIGYKSDEYHDPFLNSDIAIALNLATRKELEKMKKITLNINEILRSFLEEKGIILVDFKLEFGKDEKGNILLADEISPDTCRFWDAKTKEIMDKDRFRKDMGNVLNYYEEIKRRIMNSKNNQ